MQPEIPNNRLNDREYEIFIEITDYVTAGGGSSFYWQINPEKLSKFLAKNIQK